MFEKQAYKRAEKVITGGLSLGARILLGSVAAVFALMMFSVAESRDEVFGYLAGAFCLFVTLACFTAGRVRQFIGSSIGVAIFLLGAWYLIEELRDRAIWSGERPFSTFKAHLYLIFIGIPGVMYAFRVRFGFHAHPPAQPPSRRITGFHQDAESHWVAELECGHSQHVRHDPPWQNRPWVVTPEGRAQALGQSLNCPHCTGV